MGLIEETINEICRLDDTAKISVLLSKGNCDYKKVLRCFNDFRDSYYFDIVLFIVFVGIRTNNKPIYDLKHKGAFLLLEDSEKSDTIIDGINRLLILESQIELPTEDVIYLKTKQKFGHIVTRYRKDVSNALEHINNYGLKGVADLLSFCSKTLNMDNYNPLHGSRDYNDDNNYTYLEWCDGTSLLLKEILKTNICVSSKNKQFIYRNKGIDKIIKPFVKYSIVKEYELLCDYFDYRMTFNKKQLRIECDNIELAKSIDLAFIMDSQNSLASAIELAKKESDNNAKSLSSFLNDNSIVELVPKDDFIFPRYVYKINTAVSSFLGCNFILDDEKVILGEIIKELLISYNEIGSFKIKDTLSLLDITKIRRLFLVIAQLLSNTPMDENVFYNSATQLSSLEDIKKMMKGLYPDNNVVNDIVDLFDFNNPNNVSDILYCPFIQIDKHVLYSPILFAYASLERNAIQLAKKRSKEEAAFRVINNRNEYVEFFLSEICKKCSIDCLTNNEKLNYKYNGRDGEIDALIYNDDYLIIVECKSPTNSTNIHELKSVFDYLKKAEKQLDLSVRAFSDTSFYSSKMKELGIIDRPRSIKTLICNASRSFNGFKLSNHPIRSIKELYNYLDTGEVRIGSSSYNVRIGDTPFEWLINYISQYSYIYDIFDCLSDDSFRFYADGYDYSVQKYGLDIYKLKKVFASKYMK